MGCGPAPHASRNRTALALRRGPLLGSDVRAERQPPILKTLPPHFGHVPWIAGLPFFIVIFCGFWTWTFILSLTQYASAMLGSSSTSCCVAGSLVPHPLDVLGQ